MKFNCFPSKQRRKDKSDCIFTEALLENEKVSQALAKGCFCVVVSVPLEAT